MLAWIFAVLAASCRPRTLHRRAGALPGVRTWPLRVLAINACQLGVVLVVPATRGSAGSRRVDLAPVATRCRRGGGGLPISSRPSSSIGGTAGATKATGSGGTSIRSITAPRRLEAGTSFYKHPLEMIVNSLVNGVLVYAVLGLSVEAGAVYTLCHGARRILLSTPTCRTPHWVGYVFQRPEMHRIHHEHGVAPEQLRRHRLVGHAVRNLAQPARMGRPLRLRPLPVKSASRHAALPRRPCAKARREPPPLSRLAGAAGAARRLRLRFPTGSSTRAARHCRRTCARTRSSRRRGAASTPRNVWDVHCHVFGNGDSGSGLWFNPAMERIWQPQQYLQRLFYLNAGCVHDSPGQVDASVVDRLLNQCEAMPAGLPRGAVRVRLGARRGGRSRCASARRSTCPTPTRRRSRARFPARFEWAASIHPYAPDALDRLDAAAARGARAIKWLPSAQGIDPASPRCDRFYREACRAAACR